MRMPTRLLAFGTLDPAAALGARSMIESTAVGGVVGAGWTTTGAGAGATLCSLAQPANAARTARESTVSLLMASLLRD